MSGSGFIGVDVDETELDDNDTLREILYELKKQNVQLSHITEEEGELDES
jgi:hypothetical protein